MVSFEHNLAWDLAHAAEEHLSRGNRSSVYAKIGAGEFSSAIEELLRCFVVGDSTVPVSLAPRVARWVAGYVGCDNEVHLRALAHRSTVPRSHLLPATPAPPHT